MPSRVTCTNGETYDVETIDKMFTVGDNSKDSIEGSNVVVATESDIKIMSSPFEGMNLKNLDLTRVKGRQLKEAKRVSALNADNIYLSLQN